MRTHIRENLPGVYRDLLADAPATSLWKDMDYLTEKIGEEFVYGIHYLVPKPFKEYAHGHFTNQRGLFQTFSEFMADYLRKFDDEKLEEPR